MEEAYAPRAVARLEEGVPAAGEPAGSVEGWSATLDPLDDPRWQRLLDRHPLARAVAPRFEELAGWRTWGLGRLGAGELVEGLLLSVRRLPGLPWALGRVTCAMLEPSAGAAGAGRWLAALEGFARGRRVVELELRLRAAPGADVEAWASLTGLEAALAARGYQPLERVEHTYVVDLQRSDEVLLASFEGRTRSAIRKAQRSGGQVVVSRDPRLLAELYAAMEGMGARKHASVPPRRLVEGLAPLIARGQALVFVERYGEVVSNLVVVEALGLPTYALGARTRAHVEGQVPGAGQLVQFEVMRFLRERGARHYDLGGCEGPTPVEGHPNFGVWRFKQRFHGRCVRFLPWFRRARGALSGRLLALAHRCRGDPG